MHLSLENLYKETYDIEMEAAALLSPRSRSVDNAMLYLGLESSTMLSTRISQEGVFEWVKNKLSNLGRKITVAINKVWAKLTRADAETKALIEKASHDKSIQLPISGKRIAAIGAIATAIAVAIAVTCKAAMSGDQSADGESKSAFEKVKQMFSGLKKEKKEGEEVQAGVVKKTLMAIRKAISSIGASIKAFFSKFKSTESAAEGAAKKDGEDNKGGIVNRVKSIAGSVRRIFTMMGEFLKNCCGWMKRAVRTAMDIQARRAENFDTSKVAAEACIIFPNYNKSQDLPGLVLKNGKWSHDSAAWKIMFPEGSRPKSFNRGIPNGIVAEKGPDYVLTRFLRGNPNVFSKAIVNKLRDNTGRMAFTTIAYTDSNLKLPPKELIAEHYDAKYTADVINALQRIESGGNEESKADYTKMIEAIKLYPKYNYFTSTRMKNASAQPPASDKAAHG